MKSNLATDVHQTLDILEILNAKESEEEADEVAEVGGIGRVTRKTVTTTTAMTDMTAEGTISRTVEIGVGIAMTAKKSFSIREVAGN